MDWVQKATGLNGGGSRASVLGVNIEVFEIPDDLEKLLPSKKKIDSGWPP